MIRLRAIYNQDDDRSKRFDAMAAYLSWPDRTALSQLEELIGGGGATDNLIRNKAIEAYSRIASLPAAVPMEEKTAAWKQALDWTKSIKDYQNVFIGMVDQPAPETLALAKQYEANPSQQLSGLARRATADITRLTKEAPVLGADGSLDPA